MAYKIDVDIEEVSDSHYTDLLKRANCVEVTPAKKAALAKKYADLAKSDRRSAMIAIAKEILNGAN
jgi:hypothetical protein